MFSFDASKKKERINIFQACHDEKIGSKERKSIH